MGTLNMRIVNGLIAVLCSLAGYAQDQHYSPLKGDGTGDVVVGSAENFEAQIQRIMREHSVLGLSMAVVKEGNIAYSKAFGAKNLERNQRLQDSDLFRIASISKSFSATAILQMVDEKKLFLDVDVGELLGFPVRNPRYPEKVITLRMLLSHTSSINDSQGYFNFDVINPSKNADWQECYNEYAPGRGYEYCNLGFNMVGAIIERVSGNRFDVHISKRILKPLGLYGGYCVDSLDAARFATLYSFDKSSGFRASDQAYDPRRDEIANYVLGYSTPVFSPTGGLKMSAPDLARYMIMHMNAGRHGSVRILSKKSSRLMQKAVAKKEGYCLGLRRVNDLIAGKTMIGHQGNAYGLHSAMFFQPKERFGFVVLSNGCDPASSGEINNALRETILILYQNFISAEK